MTEDIGEQFPIGKIAADTKENWIIVTPPKIFQGERGEMIGVLRKSSAMKKTTQSKQPPSQTENPPSRAASAHCSSPERSFTRPERHPGLSG
jgi:hypothetical protein